MALKGCSQKLKIGGGIFYFQKADRVQVYARSCIASLLTWDKAFLHQEKLVVAKLANKALTAQP